MTIGTETTDMRDVNADVPQRSPVSPILYLFYNADIFDELKRFNLKASPLGFVDDVNILTYGISTKSNCRTLKKAHGVCERWARRHGAHFAPAKYELLHLVRKHKRFNMEASIKIGSVIKTPTTAVRVLEVQIDTKLKWGPHLKFIQSKMITQTLALSRLTTSTWGVCFAKARHVYNAVIRPAITFGSSIWHSPCGAPDSIKKTDKLLNDIQRECLRVVSGGFRATPQPIIEVETHMMPINLHLAHLQARTRKRLAEHGHNDRIETYCERIKRKLIPTKGRRRRQITATPAKRKRG